MLFGFACMADAGENSGENWYSHLGENSINWLRFLLELMVREAHLSENSWEPDVFRFSGGLGERSLFWAKGSLTQARRSHPSENVKPAVLSKGSLA